MNRDTGVGDLQKLFILGGIAGILIAVGFIAIFYFILP
jgi:hypothetical protein